MEGQLTIEITGTAPLLMHAPTLVDPLAKAKKDLEKITRKTARAMVDEDHLAKYQIQFRAALYHHPDAGPYVPGVNIAKALLEAARLSRSGPKVSRGLIFVSEFNGLGYDGPRDVDGLWADPRFRRTMPVNGNPSSGKKSMVMACRPMFPEWSCKATLLTNPSVLSREDVAACLDAAGSMIGLGDWRPWHGRFEGRVL